MKKILYKNALLFFAILFFSVQYTQANETPSTVQRLKNTVNKFIITLYPSYFASDEEKKAAQDTINNLLQERIILEEQLKNNTLSLKQKVILRKEINEINNDIDAQKIITGERLSLVQKTLIGLGISSTIIMPISFYILFKQLQQPTQQKQPTTQPTLETEYKKGILTAAWYNIQKNTDLETLKNNIRKIEEKGEKSAVSLANIQTEPNYQSLKTEYQKAQQDYLKLMPLWEELTFAQETRKKIKQKHFNEKLNEANLINKSILATFRKIQATEKHKKAKTK